MNILKDTSSSYASFDNIYYYYMDFTFRFVNRFNAIPETRYLNYSIKMFTKKVDL